MFALHIIVLVFFIVLILYSLFFNNTIEGLEGGCANEPCAKCQAKVGYAWKCWKCLKYFPKTNTDRLIIQDPKLSRQEKMLLLKPPKCPYCRSPKVNYVSAEDATFG